MNFKFMSELSKEIGEVYNLREVEIALRDKIKQDVKSEMGKFQKNLLSEIDKKFYSGIDIFKVILNLKSALLYGDGDGFKFLSKSEKEDLDHLSRFCIKKLLEYHKDDILASITDESVKECLYNNVSEWSRDKDVMSLTSNYLQTDVINNMIDTVMDNNPQYVLDYLNSKIENDLSEKMNKLKTLKERIEKAKSLIGKLDLGDDEEDDEEDDYGF